MLLSSAVLSKKEHVLTVGEALVIARGWGTLFDEPFGANHVDDGKRRRRDQGGQHEADDDEAGLHAPAGDVAQAHAEHVAGAEEDDCHARHADGALAPLYYQQVADR